MTQDDIVGMAREANRYASHQTGDSFEWHGIRDERFAALIAAAQREKLAHWMRSMGYATGHGDTIEDLLDHLGTQISEGLEIEALTEREACAKVADLVAREIDDTNGTATYIAAVIRARSKE
jgi:phosphatidylserine/phosphatidylglycerophosphate/cardiolipin synthase-like enzyme